MENKGKKTIIMTKEEFEEFENVDLPCALFHVMSDDVNSETGAKCEEQILIEMLAANPGALKYKSLKRWVDEIVGTNFLKDVIAHNNEIINKQKNHD